VFGTFKKGGQHEKDRFDFGLKYNDHAEALGTIIIDKNGSIRFKSQDEVWSRTSASRIIKELKGIQ
jgi:hypothetical protein